MTHFPPYHFIAGAGVAGNIDTPYVDATPWIDKKSERDLLFLFVQLRRGIDVGKRIAIIAKAVFDRVNERLLRPILAWRSAGDAAGRGQVGPDKMDA